MSDTTRSGFVAIVGKPNVGKSTLLNSILGVKIAPISPKPQTTRRGVRGIATKENAQAIFVDTPGIHKPKDALGRYMNNEARQSLSDVDAGVWVVDLRHPPTEEDKLVARELRDYIQHNPNKPIWLVGNKLDAAKYPSEAMQHYGELLHGLNFQSRSLSAQSDPAAVAALLDEILLVMPENPFFFPANQKADQSREQWASEIIREEAMKALHEELPYAVAVKVLNWEEREDGMQVIEAEIYVERSNHRKIVIGTGANMLKNIGRAARKQLEIFLSKRVYLALEVVVMENWRSDEEALRELGYE